MCFVKKKKYLAKKLRSTKTQTSGQSQHYKTTHKTLKSTFVPSTNRDLNYNEYIYRGNQKACLSFVFVNV